MPHCQEESMCFGDPAGLGNGISKSTEGCYATLSGTERSKEEL